MSDNADNPSIGLDHVTVVPENAEQRSATRTGSTDPAENYEPEYDADSDDEQNGTDHTQASPPGHSVETLGDKSMAPYGIDWMFDDPTVAIGNEPGMWWFSPDELREIAREVEAAHERGPDRRDN